MLEVQKYLKDGKTCQDLNAELGINATYHDRHPLVILNYDQIESPRLHPIVRECRGLVLEVSTWNLVARSFPRFFNLHENGGHPDFVWEKSIAYEKLDGSLLIVFAYKGELFINTRGSFGHSTVNGTDKTWRQLYFEAVGNNNEYVAEPNLTFVFELTSPYNKIVTTYPKTSVTLLSVFEGEDEFTPQRAFCYAMNYGVAYPAISSFTNGEAVESDLRRISESNPTFEGYVIRDINNQRIKVKSATYVALHRLKGNDNIFLPKYIVPIVLAGETDEVLTYFEEATAVFEEVKATMNAAYNEMMDVWAEAKVIENQKEFALAICGKTRFTGILFTARKTGQDPAELWKMHAEGIVKVLF
jgi:hypothetical protein